MILNALLANFPAKMPQVSTFEAVFGSARDRNLAISIVGTRTVRRPAPVEE